MFLNIKLSSQLYILKKISRQPLDRDSKDAQIDEENL